MIENKHLIFNYSITSILIQKRLQVNRFYYFFKFYIKIDKINERYFKFYKRLH